MRLANRLAASLRYAQVPVAKRSAYGIRHFSKSLPPGATLLPMPALSPTMTHGAVATWALGEGDAYNPGDVICEIETDKATVDYEAVEEGILAQILVQPGTKEIEVGKPLAITVEEQSAVDTIKQLSFTLADFSGEEEDIVKGIQEAPEPVPVSSEGNIPEKQLTQHGEVRASPAASVILASYGVDSATVKGKDSLLWCCSRP